MGYRLEDLKEGCCIVENDTDHVIDTFSGKSKSVFDMCRRLNLGSGFQGWTPWFFAKGKWNGKTS